MRYFTREYIQNSQNIIQDGILAIDDRAGVKDEVFYQELYQNNYNNCRNAWGSSFTEDEFRENFNWDIQFFRERLPESIISKIADFRVAALKTVSQEIYQDITEHSKRLSQHCEEAEASYRKDYAESKKYFSASCKKALECDISDARILKYEENEEQLLLFFSLDAYTVESDYDLVYIFKKGKFTEKLGTLENSWLYNYEIYAAETFVEFHIISCEASQCIIQAEDLDYRYSESFKYREGIE